MPGGIVVKDMNITLRLERPEDYRAVEELTRETFWRTVRGFCDEHLLVHRLRKVPVFVPELDFVAEMNGRIVGNIMYTRARIEDTSGEAHEVLTFGPLSVLPEYQNRGIGKALMRHTFEEARKLGWHAIVIFGHPDYYPRIGFRRASEFGITTADGKNFDAFMALPLYEGALDGIQGRFYIDPVFENLDENDVLEFDKGFPPKERYAPVPVGVLLGRLDAGTVKAIEGLGCTYLDELTHRSEREIMSGAGIDEKAADIIRQVMQEHGWRWGRK
jgi:predicted N-acetyltransferase YhbS